MNPSLLGKTLLVLRPTTGVVPSEGMRGNFVSLSAGDTVVVKSNSGRNKGILLAEWHGKDILVFEQDLQEALESDRLKTQ